MLSEADGPLPLGPKEPSIEHLILHTYHGPMEAANSPLVMLSEVDGPLPLGPKGPSIEHLNLHTYRAKWNRTRHHQSLDRSNHSGFSDSINSIFLLRFQPFSCFSLAIASSIHEYSSM